MSSPTITINFKAVKYEDIVKQMIYNETGSGLIAFLYKYPDDSSLDSISEEIYDYPYTMDEYNKKYSK